MDSLTSVQLSEWEAYDRIDPIGTWREDFRFAQLYAILTNLMTWANAKRGTKYTAEDFMMDWDVTAPQEVKQQTVEEMKKVLQDIAQVQNKKVGALPKKERPTIGIQPKFEKRKTNGSRDTISNSNS